MKPDALQITARHAQVLCSITVDDVLETQVFGLSTHGHQVMPSSTTFAGALLHCRLHGLAI